MEGCNHCRLDGFNVLIGTVFDCVIQLRHLKNGE